MAIKKIKISELPLGDTLKGLYTIGVNALNKSVKISLEFLGIAAENADEATKNTNAATEKAKEATGAAIIATRITGEATEVANAATKNADEATKNTKAATELTKGVTTKADQATENANTEAGRAKQHADNPPIVGANNNWWHWSEESGKYEDTGKFSRGTVAFPTLFVNEDDMSLHMYYPTAEVKDSFFMEEGNLMFKIK